MEENTSFLSASLSSGLQLENVENNVSYVQEKENGLNVVNIAQSVREDIEVIETPKEYCEESCDSACSNEIEYFEEHPVQLKSGLVRLKSSKEKCPSQRTARLKLKDYNIKAKRNSSPKLPSYFKLDKATSNLLEMLIEHRHVGEFHSAVTKGLNSTLIHAHCFGRYHSYFPSGNAVKVYKLSSDIERNNAIFRRAQRENDHLVILRNQHFGNNFPHPVHYCKNVIVMSFIGDDQEPAPSITRVPSIDFQKTYQSVVHEMDSWYNKLNLVHGNLSAKTVLYWQGIPHFVGWSHSVPRDHPKASMKLIKDCYFVTKLFEKRNVPVKSTEELFKKITGVDKLSKKLLDMIYGKKLWQEHKANPNKTDQTTSSNGKSRFK